MHPHIYITQWRLLTQKKIGIACHTLSHRNAESRGQNPPIIRFRSIAVSFNSSGDLKKSEACQKFALNLDLDRFIYSL